MDEGNQSRPGPNRNRHQGEFRLRVGRNPLSFGNNPFCRPFPFKVAGPSGQMDWIRGGPHSLSAPDLLSAIDSSLLRLGVDSIDLFQIHWPDRYVPMFGDTDYDVAQRYSAVVPMEDQLEALGRAVDAGRQLGDLAIEGWGSGSTDGGWGLIGSPSPRVLPRNPRKRP